MARHRLKRAQTFDIEKNTIDVVNRKSYACFASGCGSLKPLYFKTPPMNWPNHYYNIYVALCGAGSAVVSIIVVIVSKKFKVADSTIAVVGVACFAVHNGLLGFSTLDWEIYSGMSYYPHRRRRES